MPYRATANTTEITMKECSAYGKIGDKREETHIYALPHAQ